MTETKDTGQTQQGTVDDCTLLNGLTCCDLFSPAPGVTLIRGDCLEVLIDTPKSYLAGAKRTNEGAP